MQPEKEKSTRFDERRAKTARDLLDAARRVLAEQGYHGTKVVDIARAAGVGVGTFYLYYPTKEAVFLELVENAVARLKETLDSAQQQSTDPATITRLRIDRFFRFADENRDLFRIVFGHDASFHDVVQRSQDLFVHDVTGNMNAGMANGAFRRGNAEVWAQALVGMLVQVVSWWINQSDVSLDEVSREVCDLAQIGMTARQAP